MGEIRAKNVTYLITDIWRCQWTPFTKINVVYNYSKGNTTHMRKYTLKED